MPMFRVPVHWSMYADVYVEADDLDHAIDRANQQDLPNGEYMDGSWEIDEEYARELNGDLIDELEKAEYETSLIEKFGVDL